MRSLKTLFFIILNLLIFINLFGQQGKGNFSNCAAIFLNQNMLVNEYSPEGKCIVDANTKGELSLHAADMSNDKVTKASEKITFKVAIRDRDSKTLMLFSEKSYQEINIQDVLAQCKKGDFIVLLTLER
ncbi:MAG: hypothetical protein IPJ74_10445 [Saprospiraceae bacterium]|nr:hypothetical protein [Saprospiraceae bacterium]